MQTFESFATDLYPENEDSFREIALKQFHFQAVNSEVYRNYLTYLGVSADKINSLAEIPFLPISFFKSHNVASGQWRPEVVFTSSGTTGQEVSRHSVPSLNFYLRHSQRLFETAFGPLDQFHVLCLLPSYLERTGSSLVAMANHFIQESKSPSSGFYLNDLEKLVRQLEELKGGKKVLLLGVSFALWDMAEQFDVDLSHCIVMETGGMKGRRQEITRQELHGILCENMNIDKVYSEYGMTELLSQAYSMGNGVFECPPSMRVLLREINDPFSLENHTAGLINVIDLANAHSCSFIETQDLGRLDQNGHFEVLGRMDNSDVRGCNLLVG
ncbi:MAG: acyl transferase [Cyclobacteriaceae bacterium]|nr:acyl transferase [Cyclobacteriaceae bacterium]